MSWEFYLFYEGINCDSKVDYISKSDWEMSALVIQYHITFHAEWKLEICLIKGKLSLM